MEYQLKKRMAAKLMTGSTRREKYSRGTAAMANQTGGAAPAAATMVIATTPRNDPIRSAEYADNAGRRVNRSPTMAPAQMKTAKTSANRSKTRATLPKNSFALGHVSPPQRLSDMSGK